MPDYEAIIKAKDETIQALREEVSFLRELVAKPQEPTPPSEPRKASFPPIYDDTTKKYREMTTDEQVEHRAFMNEILGASV